jgi:hypothetical protein
MAEHDLEKLLGGFSADTLTTEERRQLYAVALQDQQLFNALADEQALKELLADPAVRLRLLQALAPQRGGSPWRSWLARFTRPTGVAWAGGVAASVFAIVLGLKVYEESLRQAAETAAVEEERPPVPSSEPQTTPPGQAPIKEAEQKESQPAPRLEQLPKDTLNSPMSGREQAAASRRREEPEQDEKRKAPPTEQSRHNDRPGAALGKLSEPPTSSSDQPAQPVAPTAGMDAQPPAKTGAATAARASARALFFGQGAAPGIGSRAQEKERESGSTPERLALRKTLDTLATVKPLALRFVIRETDGQAPDLNAGFAAEQSGSVTLTVESNQDAYIQIWRRAGDALPELLLPAKETGRISLKTAARHLQQMTLPQESDQIIVRLSRFPFGPITRQEAVMAGRGSAAQVMEAASGMEEPATYVANPDPSATELAIEIPIRASAPR